MEFIPLQQQQNEDLPSFVSQRLLGIISVNRERSCIMVFISIYSNADKNLEKNINNP